MALEASIVERLQELRRWQVEQQERLLQHQQEQRETLSREQVRMYQALGLTVQNTSVEETKTEAIFQDSLDDCPTRIDTTKKYQNILKTNIGDVTGDKHLSPQRRHELLHDFSPRLNKNEDDAYDGDQSSFQQCVLPRKQITELVETDRPSTNAENNSLEHCDRNSSDNAINLESPKDVLNNYNSGVLKSRIIDSEILIDGIKPLPLDKPVNKSLMIDDIPVPSPKKDFNTLLEERLRESQYASGSNTTSNKTEKSIKRPFLKKGQGLARFKLGTTAENTNRQIRPRTMSLPSTVRMGNAKSAKTSADKPNDVSKTVKKRTTTTEKSQKKPVAIPTRAQNRLSLKNVQPPSRIRSKSMCSPRETQMMIEDESKQIDKFNISDIESKTKRELEEVRIFELLEEKAENSSFCSTSSTVVALMQQSIQSTPLKTKSITKNKVSTLAQNWRNDTADDPSEDLLLAEIVYTTQSNNTVHNSFMTYKKQYQNGFGDIGGGGLNPEPEISDGNSTDNICELPYGTDVDPNYGADYPKNDEANYANDKDFDCQTNFEKNTSLHVRFAEYNEYKTLTDTSTISNESETAKHYSDQRAWSDCSATTDSSDADEFTSTIQDNRIKSLGSQGSQKSKSKVIQSKQTNGRSYNNRHYNDQFDKELTDGQRNEICSDTEMESDKKCYNYNGKAENDVCKSDSEQNDDAEHSEMQNENSVLADSTLVEEESDPVKSQEENGLIFKSELLKTRLLELEREIEIFRKENIAVSALKEKLQEERRTMERNFKEKESRFEERRQKLENSLQEEKKRLIREKTALENRLKDAHLKAQQSKQERLEVQSLKEQLDELREDMNQKESRWNAAQARHRSQVRILQSENSKLKQDIDKLQNTRKANSRGRLQAKHVTSSNTKAIHQINKQLESQKQSSRKQNSSSDDEEFLTQPMMDAMNLNKSHNNEDFNRINSDGSKMIIYDRAQTELKSKIGSARKRDLYENLLKDATMGLKEGEEATNKAVQSLENNRNLSKSDEQFESLSDEMKEDIEETGFYTRGDISRRANEFIAESNEAASKTSRNVFTNHTNRENYIPSLESARNKQLAKTSEIIKSPISKDNVMKVDKQGIREVQHPDGRVEFWYPNGNVKKISADGTTTKLIYYNGDVCESRKDGSVKYFYATTRTWHTTMADGLEILEFPDGQVERRSKDGTIEVSFPDGSVRILQSDGTEKWALPDGTLAETSVDGEKVLTLPNGQREVHTKDHKRREYPDGTVKLVYPDGSQETRYASGRVRLKDKDGNLLMDSHH